MLVENVERTVDYYQNILGFELVITLPDRSPFNWALVRREDVELLFQTPTSMGGLLPLQGQASRSALNVIIPVNEIEDLFERLQQVAAIVRGIHTAGNGSREFSIRDCNGYTLTFSQDLPSRVFSSIPE